MGRLGRAASGGRTGLRRPEGFPAYHARAVPGGVDRRRAGAARWFRGDRHAARIRRADPHADGLLRSGRVQRPALGGGRGRNAGREPGPRTPPVVAPGPAADGPDPPADPRAAADASRASAIARTRARGDAGARGLTGAGANAHAGAGAHAVAGAGAGLGAPGPALAVAAPRTAAAMALGRRRLVPPVPLVERSALSPATLVVMKDFGRASPADLHLAGPPLSARTCTTPGRAVVRLRRRGPQAVDTKSDRRCCPRYAGPGSSGTRRSRRRHGGQVRAEEGL
jgi:hypothetical protein